MVVINEEKCIGCGKCAADCISGTIRIREGKAKARQGCLLCGHCLAVCPADAVQIEEYEDTVRTYNSSSFDISEENMLNAIMFRRSIRNYTDKKIGKEQLEKLIMAGSHTATAKNRQEIGYIFVQDHLDQLKEQVFQGLGRLIEEQPEHPEIKTLKRFYKGRKSRPEEEMLFRNAPAVLYLTGDHLIDGGLAAQNIELMAASMGMGVLFNGYLTRITEILPEVKEFLKAEDKNILICMLVGYPAVRYERTAPRKQPEVTVL